MTDLNKGKEEKYKDPNEDSVVTDNLAGKKVDADLDNESERPADENNLITQESQKGKKVDADLDNESERPADE